MPTTEDTLSDAPIVDNPPAYPDIDRLGTSRIGRKLRRKTLDKYYTALRKYEGRPAKSGPPIPNSEKHGARRFYTMRQVRCGWERGLATRRRRAAPRHRLVRYLLNHTRLSYRLIGERVGYSAARICQLAKEFRAAMVKALNLHIHHQPQADREKPDAPRSLTLLLLNGIQLVRLVEGSPAKREAARYGGLLYGYRKGSIKARLRAYMGALHRKTGLVASTEALADAWAYAESLAALPIDEAIRRLNQAYGWRP